MARAALWWTGECEGIDGGGGGVHVYVCLSGVGLGEVGRLGGEVGCCTTVLNGPAVRRETHVPPAPLPRPAGST